MSPWTILATAGPGTALGITWITAICRTAARADHAAAEQARIDGEFIAITARLTQGPT